MRLFFLYILLILINLKLYAGAPAPSTSLPEPPYVFKKGTLFSAEIQWDKESIKKYLPNNVDLKKIVTGGIDVYFTKHNKPLNKINYVLVWADLKNDNKILVLGLIGPSYDSNRLIEKISEKKLTLSKTRLMLINEKFFFRTKINNKLAFNVTGNVKNECKEEKIHSKKIEISIEKYFIIDNKSKNVCNLDSIKIEFFDNYNNIKVNKIINAKLFKDSQTTFSNLN